MTKPGKIEKSNTKRIILVSILFCLFIAGFATFVFKQKLPTQQQVTNREYYSPTPIVVTPYLTLLPEIKNKGCADSTHRQINLLVIAPYPVEIDTINLSTLAFCYKPEINDVVKIVKEIHNDKYDRQLKIQRGNATVGVWQTYEGSPISYMVKPEVTILHNSMISTDGPVYRIEDEKIKNNYNYTTIFSESCAHLNPIPAACSFSGVEKSIGKNNFFSLGISCSSPKDEVDSCDKIVESLMFQELDTKKIAK